jgi:hypothetical protein
MEDNEKYYRCLLKTDEGHTEYKVLEARAARVRVFLYLNDTWWQVETVGEQVKL